MLPTHFSKARAQFSCDYYSFQTVKGLFSFQHGMKTSLNLLNKYEYFSQQTFGEVGKAQLLLIALVMQRST